MNLQNFKILLFICSDFPTSTYNLFDDLVLKNRSAFEENIECLVCFEKYSLSQMISCTCTQQLGLNLNAEKISETIIIQQNYDESTSNNIHIQKGEKNLIKIVKGNFHIHKFNYSLFAYNFLKNVIQLCFFQKILITIIFNNKVSTLNR